MVNRLLFASDQLEDAGFLSSPETSNLNLFADDNVFLRGVWRSLGDNAASALRIARFGS
jgi:hypothetical protein